MDQLYRSYARLGKSKIETQTPEYEFQRFPHTFYTLFLVGLVDYLSEGYKAHKSPYGDNIRSPYGDISRNTHLGIKLPM